MSLHLGGIFPLAFQMLNQKEGLGYDIIEKRSFSYISYGLNGRKSK